MTNEDRGLKIEDSNEGADEALSSILYPPSSNNRSFVVRRSSFVGIVGDAQTLPLRDGCCAAAFCIAALSLFADRRAALRELRRVLAPGGVALLVVGAQSWAQIVDWPADLAARLAAVYTQALAAGIAPLPTSPDLGGDLADLLLEAGFTAPLIRAFRLDRPTTNDQRPTTNDQRLPRTEDRGLRTEDRGLRTERRNSEPQTTDYRLRTTDSALAAELPLLPWPALRPLLAGQLPPAELVRCDELAADPQIELCALALVAQAHAA